MRSFEYVLPLFLLSFPMLAQSPLGSLTGLATDPSGAAVPNAAVTLTSVSTGVVRETRTNPSGNYVFPNLPPGEYKLSASAQGFNAIQIDSIPLAAFQTFRQDLRFTLASAATAVTVTGAAPVAIQTETPSVVAGLSTRQILELPTNLRSVYNNSGDSGLIANIMPLTIPGVVQMGSGAYWMVPGSGPNGLRLKVDGIDTTFGNFGSPDPVSQPSMESVEEFTANITTNRAEFSGLGAVTTVTKAGSNQFHGTIFWFMRNSALDARNAFVPARPFQNIHNYGFSASGPLKKDKTFIYAAWDGTRGVRAYTFSPNVPTLAMRGGQFSGVVRDPFDNNAPFAGNLIPASRIVPQALRAQDIIFPLPNFGDPSLTAGNYRAGFNGPELHTILELRLDHNLSSRHSLFGRYQYKNDDYDIPGARSALPPSAAGTSKNLRNMNFFTLGGQSTLTPSMYNELRAGLVVLTSKSSSNLNGQELLDRIGIRGLPPRGFAPGVPNFNIAGLTAFTQILLNPVNDGHFQISDNLSWIRGRHTMKFGIEVIRWFVNRFQNTNAALFGNFSFQNRFTGQPYGDFLLGLPTQVTRLDPFATQYFRWNDLSFYAQDDWKVTPRLTLSYGLRYEYNQPAQAKDDNLYSFDLNSGAVVLASEASRRIVSPAFPSTLPVVTGDRLGLGRSLRNADTNNWAPRFGFSYLLDGGGRTVLRGGWGMYYGHYSVGAVSGLVAGPFSVSTTSNNNFVNGQPLFTLENPFALPGSAGTLNLNGITPGLLNMYSHQFSVSLERELARDLGVRISYIGTQGRQLAYQRNVNQPLPSTLAFAQSRRPYVQYNNIVYADNGATNSYNGMQLGVTKRFSRGLQFSSTWILAKQLSEVDDTNNAEIFTSIENAYDRRRDRADVYSVPRHQWMNNVLYELPFGRNPVIGGWQLNALLNLSSGHWLNPVWTGLDSSNTNTFNIRPDLAGALQYPRTLAAWYDRSAFAAPAAGRFGTAPRNMVEGPGYAVFNLGLNKTFKMEKWGSIQAGASFQNVLNHLNYGQPNMTVNVAQGGAITSSHVFLPAGSARTGLVTLRWRY